MQGIVKFTINPISLRDGVGTTQLVDELFVEHLKKNGQTLIHPDKVLYEYQEDLFTFNIEVTVSYYYTTWEKS